MKRTTVTGWLVLLLFCACSGGPELSDPAPAFIGTFAGKDEMGAARLELAADGSFRLWLRWPEGRGESTSAGQWVHRERVNGVDCLQLMADEERTALSLPQGAIVQVAGDVATLMGGPCNVWELSRS